MEFREGQWVWVCNWTPPSGDAPAGKAEAPAAAKKSKKGEAAKATLEEEADKTPASRVAAKVSRVGGDAVTVAPCWGQICEKCKKLDQFGPLSQPATIELKAGGQDRNEPYGVPMDPSNIEGRQDMVNLADLQVGELMHNLRLRYTATPMKIYTYVGEILIVMNPMADIGEITDEKAHIYHDAVFGDPAVEPHIFAIGNEAYNHMIHHRRSQSIVISGESGAGKSESTKHVLGYVAHCSSKAGVKTATKGDEVVNINDQILATSLILEAFGNAKTKRNHNSSRFGKFVEIQFDSSGGILGAMIEQYLLEASRVTSQEVTERNYHIFYQLLSTLPAAEKASLFMGEVRDYDYLVRKDKLNADNWMNRPDGVTPIKDVADCNEMIGCLNKLKMEKPFQTILWSLVSAVINIGQIQFHEEGPGVAISNPDRVAQVAQLLQVDYKTFESALRSRFMVNAQVPFGTLKQAEDNRDGIAKIIYARIFSTLVSDYINKTIQADRCDYWIGVLDIFGFESFQEVNKDAKGKWITTVNKFEQLCINVTNEQLQNYFYTQLIPKQIEKYNQEGVIIANMDTSSNDPALRLIKGEKTCLFKLLDSVTVQSKNNRDWQANMSLADKRWLENIRDAWKGGKDNWEKPQFARRKDPVDYIGFMERDLRHKTDETNFCVFHYAGQVWYTVDGGVERNKSSTTKDATECLGHSAIPWMQAMFPPIDENDRSQNMTVSQRFCEQLDSLITNLSTTEPFFVRCVKPNCIMKKGGYLEDHKVLEQLICAGMYAIIQMRQNGYPVERTADAVVDLFGILEDDQAMLKGMASDNDRASHLCNIVVANYPNEVRNRDNMAPFQCGRTRFFFKDEMFRAMGSARSKAIAELKKKQARSVKLYKALVLMAKELKALPERAEIAAKNAVKFARKKELMAQGLSEAAALAQIEEEQRAELARIEAEFKAQHYDYLVPLVPEAVDPVDGLTRNIDLFMKMPDTQLQAKDPLGDNGAKLAELNKRKKNLLDLKAELTTKFAAFSKNYHDGAAEEEIKALVAKLQGENATEAAQLPKDEAAQKIWIETREKRLAEEAERQRKEEEERKERERLERIKRLKEEAERKERERKAAIEAEKQRRQEIREAKRKAKNAKRDAIIAERDAKLQEEQKHAEEERERMKVEAKRREMQLAAETKAQEKKNEQLQARCNAMVGTKVKFEDMMCTVAYLGHLPYQGSQEFVGIECPRPSGEMNDGAVRGIQLFHCQPNCGKFVRASMLQIVEPSTTSFIIGQRVWVKDTHRMGEVMWVGTADFKGIPSQWIGVKLDTPNAGKHCGVVNGIKYFDAPNNRGIFAPPHKLHLILPWTEEIVQDRLERYVVLHCLQEDDTEDDLSESEIEAQLFGGEGEGEPAMDPEIAEELARLTAEAESAAASGVTA